MIDYTVSFTEAEDKAMQYVSASVFEWIDNAAHNRARIAIDEICQLYTNYKLEKEEPITAVGKPAMVLAAFEEGVIKTASERNEEFNARLPE
tara:strand:+ start:755 stop:1030 length:276 start_codon:yes stop_codon:yes gene_type:complete